MSTASWAIELSAADAESAQWLRLIPGIEARYSRDASSLWLRGTKMDPHTAEQVRRLPARGRYFLLEDGRAVPDGKRVPVRTLRGSGWVPLRHLIPLQPPPARKAGNTGASVPLRIVPSHRQIPANMLSVPFTRWLDYALSAPAIRLSPLRFAVSGDARTIIHGLPLPPLLGDCYALAHGIATPAGHALDPPLHPELLARHYQLKEGDVLLFHRDSTCELLDAAGFTQASRSAARETALALAENPESDA